MSNESGTTVADAEGIELMVTGKRVRPESVDCGWCGKNIDVPNKGRVPKWCGTSCRHRAWEQTRAATSGRAAVQIVERIVTVEPKKPDARRITTPPPPTQPAAGVPYSPPPGSTHPSGPTDAATALSAPRPQQWPALLAELGRQLDTGRIYPRDLSPITIAFDHALQAINRRITNRH